MAMQRRRRPHESTPCPFPIISIEEATKYDIPQTDEEWEAVSKLKKIDANDLMHELGPAGFIKWLNESPTYCVKWDDSDIVSGRQLTINYRTMRDPIIQGLLRRSEIMNIIAPPKSSKSWMGMNIAMNIIGGGKLFDKFQCERGRVLIVDNELHPETITQRLRDVAPALNVPLDRAGRLIDFLLLRGQLVDIAQLELKLEKIRRRTYNIIILDAFYKFYPEDFDENSNSEMARLYTKLDGYAEYLDCAMILIHHSSKGVQSGKSVTDMGAGAGTQSRACDAHLVLRENEDPGVFTIDCANRSFPPIAPFCARFKWPRWEEAPNSEPDNLKGLKKNPGAMKVGGENVPKQDWRAVQKKRIEAFITKEVVTPMSEGDILTLGNKHKFRPWNRVFVKALREDLVKDGKLRLVTEGSGRNPYLYISTSVAPEQTLVSSRGPAGSAKPQYDGYTADFENTTSDDDFNCDENIDSEENFTPEV